MNKDCKSKGGLPSEQFMAEVAAAYGTKYDDRDSDNGKIAHIYMNWQSSSGLQQ